VTNTQLVVELDDENRLGRIVYVSFEGHDPAQPAVAWARGNRCRVAVIPGRVYDPRGGWTLGECRVGGEEGA